MLRVLSASLAALTLSLSAQTLEPQEIVRRAFEASVANEKLAKQYTFEERVEERKLDKRHEVKEISSKTYDVLFLHGEEYERLIAEDGQPLPPDKQAKERKKLDKALAKLENESPKQRRKRLEKKREEEEDFRKMVREITRAFDFTLEGSETIDGVEAYRIRAEPKPGYEPEFKRAKFLTKLRGVMWIAKDDYGWVQTEAEVIDSVSFGLFLLKLKKGAEMAFSQTLVNDEVWMLDTVELRFDAKVAALKTLRREMLIAWSDFKKFAAESKLIAGDPVAESP